MTLVLIEEVLIGLEEAHESLEQTVTTLTNLIEDLTPELADRFRDRIEVNFLEPLQAHSALLETLLEQIAAS